MQVDILDLVIGRMREQDELHDGHDQDQPDDGRIAPDLPEFLLYDDEQAVHASLSLNFRMAMPPKKSAMARRMRVSVQTAPSPEPLIMTDRTIE